MIFKIRIKINLRKKKVKYHQYSEYGHLRIKSPYFKKYKGKAKKALLSDSSDSKISSSLFVDENFFMAFSTVLVFL